MSRGTSKIGSNERHSPADHGGYLATGVEVPQQVDDIWSHPLLSIEETLQVIPLSERSLRRHLDEGGNLHHLVVRVGGRIFVKTAALAELVGRTPETV